GDLGSVTTLQMVWDPFSGVYVEAKDVSPWLQFANQLGLPLSAKIELDLNPSDYAAWGFDDKCSAALPTGSGKLTREIGLIHELIHAAHIVLGTFGTTAEPSVGVASPEEDITVGLEQIARRALGLDYRRCYSEDAISPSRKTACCHNSDPGLVT